MMSRLPSTVYPLVGDSGARCHRHDVAVGTAVGSRQSLIALTETPNSNHLCNENKEVGNTDEHPQAPPTSNWPSIEVAMGLRRGGKWLRRGGQVASSKYPLNNDVVATMHVDCGDIVQQKSPI